MSGAAVVITGLGSIGPHGIARESLADALAAGGPLTTEIERDPRYHRFAAARTAALAPPDKALAPWLPRSARRMSRSSKLAVAVARLALEDAGSPDSAALSVAFATAFGPAPFTERILLEIHGAGPELVSPFLFTDCVANAAAGQVAIDVGARGANWTVCQREAGALLALRRAASEVASGRAPLALAGAVDEFSPLTHAALDRMRSLARPLGGEELPRPFDVRRNGFVLGEGANAVVLENAVAARARGARPLAVVRTVIAGFDPSAPPHGFGQGDDDLAATLVEGLARDAVDLRDIDVIVSGASGARAGDALEAGVLRRAFRDELPSVVAPKAVLGEFGGGPLAAALAVLEGRPVGRPVGCGSPDPALGVRPGEHAPACAPRRVLVTALASGGAAAWAVLDSAEDVE